MTKKSTAKTAIACAIASALTLGSFCAPALAQTQPANEGPAVCAQSATRYNEGEVTYIACTYLGFAPEDVRTVNCWLVTFDGDPCFEVVISTVGSNGTSHVIVGGLDGTIRAAWFAC